MEHEPKAEVTECAEATMTYLYNEVLLYVERTRFSYYFLIEPYKAYKRLILNGDLIVILNKTPVAIWRLMDGWQARSPCRLRERAQVVPAGRHGRSLKRTS